MIRLSHPDHRRALRSVIQAVAMLALIALVWVQAPRLTVAGELAGLLRLVLLIVGLSTVFYGAENVTRAVKLTGPGGTGIELGRPDAVAAAAERVADAAENEAEAIKEEGA